ncbi:Phosphoglycolate phosphatase [Giardia lamblia P15]|uniref:Phosphoglycolate phosphatase n=1 Tax=Giardia intestinalis (strain P15) TaxID=658858 RepID=E1F7T2_GIAIA|nr:Phosphoglycolate phosphatase [Giardia lamblia P15]
MLLIFDVDGTLIDNVQVFVSCINGILGRHGYPPFSQKHITSVIGWGCEHTIKALLPDVDEITQLQLAKEYREEIKAIQLEPQEFFNGAFDVMARLTKIAQRTKNSGRQALKLAILSNKEHDATLIVADKAFSAFSFDVILGAEKSRRSKPYPDGLLDIMQRCYATPEDTWMIGDMTVDIQAGVAAGVKTIGCTWGFHSKDILAAENPTYLVNSWHELEELLMKLVNSS